MERDGATRRAGIVGEPSDARYALVASGSQGGVITLTLPAADSMVLGREPPAELVLPNDSVSRRHARIHASAPDGPPLIEDLGSTNGTKVMGRLLTPGERVPIPFGSVLQIGSVVAFVQPAGLEPPDERPLSSREPARPTSRGMTVAPPAMPVAPRSVVLRDPTMIQLYALIDVIAPSKLSILVLGETGVGKDVFAETLHGRSPRATGPFLRLNCAALPENLLEAELFGYERGAFTGAIQSKPGLFEAADGGTVFLDEIGEMPLLTQAKLLRVLESGEVMRIGSVRSKRVDVRFVAATNRDLEVLSTTGQFRSDLYFRLNGVSVTIPPLRRRLDDIVPLANFFLATAPAAATRALTAAAVDRLRAYRWPGNIRELKNVLERAALLARGGEIAPEHLMFGSAIMGQSLVDPVQALPSPPPIAAPPSSMPAMPPQAGLPSIAPAGGTIRDAFAEVERERILDAMEKCGGNQSRAAKMLGISRTTLIKRLEAYAYVRPRKGQE